MLAALPHGSGKMILGEADPDINEEARWLYITLFTLSLAMFIAQIASFFKYRAYNNTSTATLIGITIIMWVSTSIIWGLCVFQPPFFTNYFITVMDLSNFVSGYLCNVMNIAVLLQWAQVFRVISNPDHATETLVQNWAAKVECCLVFIFTLTTVGSIYFTTRDNIANPNDDASIEGAKYTFQVVSGLIRIMLIFFYGHLLYNFRKLIRE